MMAAPRLLAAEQSPSVNSINKLETMIRRYESSTQSVLKKLQEKIDAAKVKLDHINIRARQANEVWEEDKRSDQLQDAVDETFQNFALALAEAATPSNAKKMVEARVPEILVNLLNGKNFVLKSQTAMALYKISLQHDDVRREIVLAGGISACVPHMQPSEDPEIICHISRTLASLALLEEHKPLMSARGALQALTSYFQHASKLNNVRLDKPISSVLIALCHCVEGHDANRNILIDLEITRSIAAVLVSTKCRKVISCAAKAIANIAFNNAFTAKACLDSSCVAKLISANTETKPSDMEASISVMTACSNLSNTESNQIKLGKSGAIQTIINLLENCDDSAVLKEASTACASICYSAAVIRKQMGKLGAMEALVDVILYKGMEDDINEAKSAEAASLALVTLLREQTNRALLEKSGELPSLVGLYEKTDSMDVLNAGAMFVCSMIPNEEEKAVLLQEGRTSAIEKACGGRVLKRCSEWIYGRGLLPNWLSTGIALIKMTEDGASSILEKHGRKNNVPTGSLPTVDPNKYFPQMNLFSEVRVHDQETFFVE